jgi:hypothetical protein
MSHQITNDDFDHPQHSVLDAFERLDLESDDEGSIASYSGDSQSDCPACPAHIGLPASEQSEANHSGSDAGFEDAGGSSNGSLDFTQSPRAVDNDGTHTIHFLVYSP